MKFLYADFVRGFFIFLFFFSGEANGNASFYFILIEFASIYFARTSSFFCPLQGNGSFCILDIVSGSARM